MKKYGFTLIELLAVIAILSMLALIAVPNAIEIYNEGIKKEMKVQENNVKDAANLYVEDYCTDKIDDSLTCPNTYEYGITNSITGITSEKYVCLRDLQSTDFKYIGDVKYKKDDCEGFVIYYLNEKTGTYDNPKTYLYCGWNSDRTYNYMTDETFNRNAYKTCLINELPR